MTEQSPATDAHCYAYNRGGINNQKLALFGLFLKALREKPHRLVLPDLVCFDQITFVHARVPLSSVFEIEPLRRLAATYGIDVLETAPRGDEGGWDFFHHGDDYIPYAALTDQLAADSFTCAFFRSLVPKIRRPDLLLKTIDGAFGQHGIDLVLQLRIEKDWVFHIDHRLAPVVTSAEVNTTSFHEIVAKIRATLGDAVAPIYVTCDEAALPVLKDEIRTTVKQQFGLDMFWKSDFLSSHDMSDLSPLELSVLDFEVAIAAKTFIGTTRSTFSNMVALTKYACTGRPVEDHYVYNMNSAGLARRRDNGAFTIPILAAASDPRDPAYSFHLGHIFQSVGELHRALGDYAARADTPEADLDERYISLCRIAEIKGQLGFSARGVIAAYRRATDLCPNRAEAWHGASRCARLNQMFVEAYDLSKPAITLVPPTSDRFVEHWIYLWGVLDEHSVNASWTGRYREALDACLDVLGRGTVPEEHRARIAGNAAFCLEQQLKK